MYDKVAGAPAAASAILTAPAAVAYRSAVGTRMSCTFYQSGGPCIGDSNGSESGGPCGNGLGSGCGFGFGGSCRFFRGAFGFVGSSGDPCFVPLALTSLTSFLTAWVPSLYERIRERRSAPRTVLHIASRTLCSPSGPSGAGTS